jgi:hypothetical protein
MYSDSLFDAYSVTMGGADFFGDEDTLDIDYEEIDEIEAGDMDAAVKLGDFYHDEGDTETMKHYYLIDRLMFYQIPTILLLEHNCYKIQCLRHLLNYYQSFFCNLNIINQQYLLQQPIPTNLLHHPK